MDFQANETDNETIAECSDKFRTQTFLVVAYLRAVVGSLSFFTSLLVIVIIVYFRKYIVLTQKLVLYLTISTMLNGLAVATQAAVYYPDTNATDIYCQMSGYLNQVTAWASLIAILLITIHLYQIATTSHCSCHQVFHILLIFVLPLAINWIPFINSSYGLAGPWCWIIKSNEDCSSDVLGKVLRFCLWFLPILLLILILICVYVLIFWKIKKEKRRFTLTGHHRTSIHNQNILQKELRPLLFFPAIFLVLNLFPLINEVAAYYRTDRPVYLLWFAEALFTPLPGVIIALVYTFDAETVRRLRKFNLLNEYRSAKRSKSDVTDYPLIKTGSDSYFRSLSLRADDNTGVTHATPYQPISKD